MKFLVKTPVVGLKIFDGDLLNKRLQITFASEAHYNFFSNKIQQWIGISLQSGTHIYADLQKSEVVTEQQALSNDTQNLASTSTKLSQIASPDMSQPFTQEVSSQRIPFLLSQSLSVQEPVKTSVVAAPPVADHEGSHQKRIELEHKSMDETSLYENYRNYLDASRIPTSYNGDTSILSQSTDLFSNNTQYNTYLIPGQFPPTTDSTITPSVCAKPSINRQDIKDLVKALPFNTARKKQSKSSRSKKSNSMDRILEKTLAHILKEKKKSFLTMDDEELAINVARKLQSQSFLKLLKRVEHLISD